MPGTQPKNQSAPAATPSGASPVSAVDSIKRYDEDFRKHAVEHWINTDQPGAQIVAKLGISHPSFTEGRRGYRRDTMPERRPREGGDRGSTGL